MELDGEFADWTILQLPLWLLMDLYSLYDARPKLIPVRPKPLGLCDLPDVVFNSELKAFRKVLDEYRLRD